MTASEPLFRLRGCPEDDTMFLSRKLYRLSGDVMVKSSTLLPAVRAGRIAVPVLVTPGRFYNLTNKPD